MYHMSLKGKALSLGQYLQIKSKLGSSDFELLLVFALPLNYAQLLFFTQLLTPGWGIHKQRPPQTRAFHSFLPGVQG